jgi:hypothetical protein
MQTDDLVQGFETAEMHEEAVRLYEEARAESGIDERATVTVSVYVDSLARAQWLAAAYGRNVSDVLAEAIERGLPEIGGALPEPDNFQ